jgi:hypothetical protein
LLRVRGEPAVGGELELTEWRSLTTVRCGSKD